MKAKIKKMNLPPAPPPTRPVTASDPREQEYWEHFAEQSDLMRGFKPRPTRMSVWTPEKLLKLKHMWRDGNSVKNCAERLGMEEKTIRYKVNYLVKKGELRPRKKILTDAERQQVRDFVKRGMTKRSIARHFGTSTATICNICKEEK